MEDLINIITLLLALSIASERLVEILKNLSQFLREQKSDAEEEGRRKSAIQALGIVAGIITALLARPAIVQIAPNMGGILPTLALGLLASGGSGLWNSVLTYVLKVKDIRTLDSQIREAELDALKTATPKQPPVGPAPHVV